MKRNIFQKNCYSKIGSLMHAHHVYKISDFYHSIFILVHNINHLFFYPNLMKKRL